MDIKPAVPGTVHAHPGRASLGFSIVHLIMTILAVILAIVGFDMAVTNPFAEANLVVAPFAVVISIVASPIILAGIFGIIAGATKNICTVITAMVFHIMCVFSFIWTLLGVGVVLAVYEVPQDIVKNAANAVDSVINGDVNGAVNSLTGQTQADQVTHVNNLGIAVCLIAGVLLIISIIISALTCAGTCCCRGPKAGHLYVQHPVSVYGDGMDVTTATVNVAGQGINYTVTQHGVNAPLTYGYDQPRSY